MPTPETSAPAATQASPSRRDCRVYERHPCGLKTSCQPPTTWGQEDLHWQAEIRDISQGGLALLLRRRFEKGAGLAVELPGSDPATPSTVLVRVVHIRAQPDGFWLLGCSFVSHLSGDEVRSLTADTTTTARQQAAKAEESSDQATFAVVPSEANRLVVREVLLETILADGRVIRRRLDELNVRCTWPVEAGTRFVLRTNRGLLGKTGIPLQVKSCTRRGEQWVLRCSCKHAEPTQVAAALGFRKRAKKG